MKNNYFKIALVILLTSCLNSSFSQTILNPGRGDSLFPVTGRFYQPKSLDLSLTDARAFTTGIINYGNKFIVGGNFEYWSKNQGSSLIADTNTNSVLSNWGWDVQGEVRVAVSDGNSGFFIGGSFNSVGDSVRNNIAHIGSNGIPTSWKVVADAAVNAIVIRNDTLFTGGEFSIIGGQNRNKFALISKTNGSVFNGGATGLPNFDFIRALILNQDTVICAGRSFFSNSGIKKYNFRNSATINWTTPMTGGADVIGMDITEDKSTIIYATTISEENYVRGISYNTGAQLYNVVVSSGEWNRYVSGIKCYENTGYAYGRFSIQQGPSGQTTRSNLFAFNAKTGFITADNFNVDGFVSCATINNGNIYLSGRFTSVYGSPRHQFASLNLATMSLNNFQLTASDPATAMGFYNGSVFFAGSSSGMNAIRKSTTVLVDKQSRDLAPWNSPLLNQYSGWGKTMIRGDTLFVLSKPDQAQECFANTEIKILSLSTGATLGLGEIGAFDNRDMLIDGNFLYTASDAGLRRYFLPSLARDVSWFFNFNGAVVTKLFSHGQYIYGIGDERIGSCTTTHYPEVGFILRTLKSNYQSYTIHYYQAPNVYDIVRFKNAVIVGNKMFVHGDFTQINGINRNKFFAADLTTGAITNWNPSFPIAGNAGSFSKINSFTEYKGRLWFGAARQNLNDGTIFQGFGGIDTTAGGLVQPFKFKINYHTSFEGGNVNDFLISDSAVVFAGAFDSINSQAFRNFAVFRLNGINEVNFCAGGTNSFTSNISGTSYQWQMDSGSGFVNIADNANFTGTQTATLQLSNIPTSWFEYKLRCSIGGNFSDIFKIRFKAVWTGAINNSWENGGNWNCGSVPDANTDVLINNGGNPILSTGAVISTIQLSSGAILNILPSGQLTVLR